MGNSGKLLKLPGMGNSLLKGLHTDSLDSKTITETLHWSFQAVRKGDPLTNFGVCVREADTIRDALSGD